MITDKLSTAAKSELFGKFLFARLIANDSELIDEQIIVLAQIADQLDNDGFCEAADEIDALIKEKSKKIMQPGRIEAKLIRKRLSSK